MTVVTFKHQLIWPFSMLSNKSLMHKLVNIGVEGNMWTIINSLHQDARLAVKWRGGISKQFPVEQGVRQGGILSTDFYKVYNDGLLDRLTIAKMSQELDPSFVLLLLV